MKDLLIPGEEKRQIVIEEDDITITLPYDITSQGQVITNKGKTPKRMKPQKDKDGYLYVDLRSPHFKGGRKRCYIHCLVGRSFIENPEGKPIIHHKNSDKTDNRVENLARATHRENTGEASFRGDIKSDLTSQALYEIRQKRFLNRVSDKELAQEYGVKKRRVSDYLAGRSRQYCAEKIRNGEYDDVVDDVDIVLTLAPGSIYK